MYEYLTSQEILPSSQKQMMEQARFTYSPSRKAFEKQKKPAKDQGIKQVETLKALKPEEELKSN